MILVNSGAFLSISSWFCELTELIFVVIPHISSTSYPPKTQGIMGHVQVANIEFFVQTQSLFTRFLGREDWTLGWIKAREVSWEAVSIKHGLRTTDYGLGIKHGLGYKTRTKHYGLGIKYGPSITDSA